MPCTAYSIHHTRLIIRQLSDVDGRNLEQLPLVEKKARRNQLEQDLPGLDQKGMLAISDALVDCFAKQVKTGELTYVRLADCTSLGEETAARVAGGQTPRVDTSTVHGAWLAIQRRALAYHASGICSHEFMNADLSAWYYKQLVGDNREKQALTWEQLYPVSYTHLTLPTKA